MKKNKLNDYITLPAPTDSLAFFEAIKELSNQCWTKVDIDKDAYGFQIQEGSKWRDGLSDKEISEFENELGFSFPEGLRNFYKTMNGLDKKGINVLGSCGDEFTYSPVFYSFPDDLDIIKAYIEWIYEATNMDTDKLLQNGISRIFPVCYHRFVLVDDPRHPILSMYGDDIIPWTGSISKLIATAIFDNIYNASCFERLPNDFNVKFWLD